MATDLVIRTQKLTRDKLASFLPNHELVKAFENLTSDVSVTLPELVAIAQAAADAAAAAVAALELLSFVEVGAVNPATPNARSLAVAAAGRLSLSDGGAGASATLDLNLGHANVFTKNQSTAQSALVDAAAVAVDASLSNGFQLLTTAAVGATRLLANPTNLSAGMLIAFEFVQPAAGGPCALTFDTLYDFGPAGTPSLSTGANAIDLMFGYYDGAKLVCMFRSASGGGVSLSTVNIFTKNQSVAPFVLTDAASVTTNASLANDFVLTIGGNRTLANPTNLTDGMQLLWTIIQDATGSRTLTYGSAFDFGASASSLSTAPGATDIIYGVYNTATGKIKCFIRRDAGSSTLGLQITAYPQGVVTSSAVGTTNLNNQAFLLPINLASPMWVQSLIVQCSTGGTVVLTWGLFDYSASASAPVMLVTGSGTAGAAGTITLAATGAPVYVPAGSYMLVFSAGPTGTASVVFRTTSVVGNALSKKSSAYTWTTTPNFTTGWSSDTTVINAVLQGRLSATDLW